MATSKPPRCPRINDPDVQVLRSAGSWDNLTVTHGDSFIGIVSRAGGGWRGVSPTGVVVKGRTASGAGGIARWQAPH